MGRIHDRLRTLMRHHSLIALMLVVPPLLIGCEEPKASTKSFATEAVVVGPLIDSVLATGRVQTVKSVNVSSQLSGRVDEVYVDFNDVVEKDAPLARLDPQRFQSRVEELDASLAIAEAELTAAEAALEGAQARLEEDRRDYARKSDLAKRGGVSESEVTRARATMLQSESALQTLAASKAIKTATITAARAALSQAQIDLERTIIRAPISGIVIDRKIEPGQTVAASLAAPELFTIAEDLSSVLVHARVDEADVGKVAVGQTVSFTVDAHPGRRFHGLVDQIRKAPEIVQGVVSYAVVIAATNKDQLMLPGMTAIVEIVTARKDNVLRIPNAALRFELPEGALEEQRVDTDANGSAQGAWVLRGRREFERVALGIGYSDGEYTEVTSGPLVAGDHVIVGFRQ